MKLLDSIDKDRALLVAHGFEDEAPVLSKKEKLARSTAVRMRKRIVDDLL